MKHRAKFEMGAESIIGGIAGATLTALYFFTRSGKKPSDAGAAGKIVLPPAYSMVDYTLFSDRVITDTKTYYPDELLDLSQATYWGFDVENSTDQDVTCELIGGSRDIPASAGPIGSGAVATIGKGLTLPIATDIWMPYLDIRVSYKTSPTSGKLRITGWVQERLF